MAKRKKRRSTGRKTKLKTSTRKTRTTKKSVKRTVGRKSRRTAKTTRRTSRKQVTRRKGVAPAKPEMVPVVEGEIIDVVDEPMPGVIRVTEIETTRVAVPDSEDNDDEEK
jgi:hypothetical protein